MSSPPTASPTRMLGEIVFEKLPMWITRRNWSRLARDDRGSGSRSAWMSFSKIGCIYQRPSSLGAALGGRGLNRVGADLVEVAPPCDTSSNTALLGAGLRHEMLCVLPGVAPAPQTPR
jgi:hypothetical protein